MYLKTTINTSMRGVFLLYSYCIILDFAYFLAISKKSGIIVKVFYERGLTMEEINLKEMFDFFISKIYIIIIGVTVTTLLGIFYMSYLQVPMYKSETTILLVNEDKENLQADIITNQKLVTT